MISTEDINKAFSFYNISPEFKERSYQCVQQINDSKIFANAVSKVYKKLYLDDFNELKELWDIENKEVLFASGIDPFVTNIMILIGYKIHAQNLDKNKLGEQQLVAHKKRVKECFEKDLIQREYNGVRISQMLWATYFIRLKIIEVGRLQYEKFVIDDKPIIKIHIPEGSKLDINLVKKSIKSAKKDIANIFGLHNCEYMCESWLLSNQIHSLVDKETNIYKFHELFWVKDGQDCGKDILNFVYKTNHCSNYSMLEENTSLQKIIKKELMAKGKFYLGIGVLK